MVSRVPYYMGFVFLIISFVFCAIAFGTGYWFVAEGEGRLFTRLGLWEACFNGFEYTSDYIGKAYYGCWWIFHQEYSYIREWIIPCEYLQCKQEHRHPGASVPRGLEFTKKFPCLS